MCTVLTFSKLIYFVLVVVLLYISTCLITGKTMRGYSFSQNYICIIMQPWVKYPWFYIGQKVLMLRLQIKHASQEKRFILVLSQSNYIILVNFYIMKPIGNKSNSSRQKFYSFYSIQAFYVIYRLSILKCIYL